jgi:hypothetical protein
MTEPGETDDFTLEDHLRVIHQHAPHRLFDYVLVNTRPLSPYCADEQARLGAIQVPIPKGDETSDGIRIVRGDFLLELPGGGVRHSPERLSSAILGLVEERRMELLRQESLQSATSVRPGRVPARPLMPPILAGPQNL